ncbi:MAG: hypothetical protein J1E62_03610 [Lachnospiraceae bacterium]|nr:hypothetical protein [Lachnospiraceae bacterium]
MKKKSMLILSLLGLLVLSGCGSKSEAPYDVSVVSTGSAISASTVFKNSETSAKENRFENDYIRIWNNGTGWVQESVDGTGMEKLSIGESDFDALWLTNDWMYYMVHHDDYSGEICRIPFHYNGVSVFDTKNKEILVKMKYIISITCDEFMITDSNMIYVKDNLKDDDSVVYQYDFETKKSTQIKKECNFSFVLDQATLLPLTMGNTFFTYEYDESDPEGKDCLYRVSFDTLEKKKIYSGDLCLSDGDMASACIADNALYFLAYTYYGKNGMMKYDGDKDEVTCVLDSKALGIIIRETNIIDEKCDDDGYITSICIWNDRIYMGVYASWLSEEVAEGGSHKGDVITIEHRRELLLSSKLDNLAKWSLEDKLHNYIIQNSIQTVYSITDLKNITYNVRAEDAVFDLVTMYNNKVFFRIYNDSLDETSFYIYDIESGEIDEVSNCNADYRYGWYKWEVTLGQDNL